MRQVRVRQVLASVGVIALAVCTTAALAQDFGFRGRRVRTPIVGEKTPYDGRYTFGRLRHGYEMGREPPWAHDYPRAEFDEEQRGQADPEMKQGRKG